MTNVKDTGYKRNVLSKSFVVVLFSLLLTACSTTPKSEDTTTDTNDPLESINRPFWTFTWDYADKYVLKPASEG